jgi:glyoxylase-like metal-dependent hydrolase (beta-lactamase superfamily II)
VRRITLPLATGPKHVHCYVIDGDDGPILVDTGLTGMERWPEVAAIVVTHMH